MEMARRTALAVAMLIGLGFSLGGCGFNLEDTALNLLNRAKDAIQGLLDNTSIQEAGQELLGTLQGNIGQVQNNLDTWWDDNPGAPQPDGGNSWFDDSTDSLQGGANFQGGWVDESWFEDPANADLLDTSVFFVLQNSTGVDILVTYLVTLQGGTQIEDSVFILADEAAIVYYDCPESFSLLDEIDFDEAGEIVDYWYFEADYFLGADRDYQCGDAFLIDILEDGVDSENLTAVDLTA